MSYKPDHSETPLSMFQAFAKTRFEVYEQAKKDAEQILSKQMTAHDDVSRHRVQAAYAYAIEQVYEKIDEIDAIFAQAGFEEIPSGINHMGLCSAAPIPYGHVVNVSTMAQEPFKPTRYLVDRETAPYFVMLDRRVGATSQFLSSAEIPCSMFTRDNHILGPLDWSSAQPSQMITVVVKNVDHEHKQPRWFKSALFGKTGRNR